MSKKSEFIDLVKAIKKGNSKKFDAIMQEWAIDSVEKFDLFLEEANYWKKKYWTVPYNPPPKQK